MITEIILPKLGQTMEEGAIVEWFKREGEPVRRGDLLFTVESDKATLEVQAAGRGFLRRILVPAGQPVPVLTVVGLMTREADESLDDYWLPKGDVALPAGEAEPAAAPAPTAPQAGRVAASPRARRLVREAGVDLGQVTGTGPGGRVVERDVIAYLAGRPKVTPVAARVAAKLGVDLAQVSGTGAGGRVTRRDVEATAVLPEPEGPALIPMSGVRGIIAQRLGTSAQTAARVTLVREVDATELVRVREGLKETVAEAWGFVPSYNDLLGVIVAHALREFAYMNARLTADGTAIEQLPVINLGVAVDTERGLLVPVIRDAGRKGLRAFARGRRELEERALAGRSTPDDLAGGTFTLTNLGMYGVDAFTPIINLPEVAILGVGRIRGQPAVREGQVVVRQMCTLSLAFDHRLVDGGPAARFLGRIAHLVENPYPFLE
jgi:pyruvate dehydrogenase E2 component (dihydrolipoamide acetyltransferase)